MTNLISMKTAQSALERCCEMQFVVGSELVWQRKVY